MVIRAYQPFDAVPLAALFYQTVHTVNRRDYTEKQLDAWAPKDIDLGVWDRSLQVHHTLVAVEDGCAVGFGDIDSNTGYLDRLYVHKGPPGHGNATALCDRLEASAAGLLCHPRLHHRAAFFEKEDIRSSGSAGGTPGDSSNQLHYGETR
ncbi:MAG: GNAT family N-acetyltransferase [Evtepia gabavorous]